MYNMIFTINLHSVTKTLLKYPLLPTTPYLDVYLKLSGTIPPDPSFEELSREYGQLLFWQKEQPIQGPLRAPRFFRTHGFKLEPEVVSSLPKRSENRLKAACAKLKSEKGPSDIIVMSHMIVPYLMDKMSKREAWSLPEKGAEFIQRLADEWRRVIPDARNAYVVELGPFETPNQWNYVHATHLNNLFYVLQCHSHCSEIDVVQVDGRLGAQARPEQ
ncbi:hypothetical protein TSTA_008610 [Talaromyces stipitatus ATCC 10500]|uniref:Uncharacterized protein n=1 Tax=Talaromyces stipitatus (strain ATCC 10500 / CBS 375.48 / QM 6759 / NRRL 1006) TaxID=441959 RepID=B8MVA9_TALSN|nr:uncharacterized protein TSTA_008610 [Talaromyces stipitatus ATCC 10500]EED11565.1 hypothetical protein TSTA_008610 [Talaromyces stipitatus ATCC 10500]